MTEIPTGTGGQDGPLRSPPTPTAPTVDAGLVSQHVPPMLTENGTEPPTTRRRWRWPAVVAIAIVMFVIGAGASYLATNPARNRLRDQRDAVQSQLDQANNDLTAAQKAASSAKAPSDACQRLTNDANTLSDDMDKLDALLQDPANQNVVSGSPEEQALINQLQTLSGGITFERGVVTSDSESCKTAVANI